MDHGFLPPDRKSGEGICDSDHGCRTESEMNKNANEQSAPEESRQRESDPLKQTEQEGSRNAPSPGNDKSRAQDPSKNDRPSTRPRRAKKKEPFSPYIRIEYPDWLNHVHSRQALNSYWSEGKRLFDKLPPGLAVIHLLAGAYRLAVFDGANRVPEIEELIDQLRVADNPPLTRQIMRDFDTCHPYTPDLPGLDGPDEQILEQDDATT